MREAWARRLGWLAFLALLGTLSVLLIQGVIGLGVFGALVSVWFVVFLFWLFGPETISEVTLWKASIKRDLEAAEKIRREVEGAAEDLREVARSLVEATYILASSSILAVGGDRPARQRVEEHLEKLTQFAEPDSKKQEQWWAELRKLFEPRKLHGEQ